MGIPGNVFAAEARAYAEAMPRWKKVLVILPLFLGWKLCIGEEKREGWTEPMPTFLFFCHCCGKVAKDYLHGQIGGRHLYCSTCGEKYDVDHLMKRFLVFCAKIKVTIRERFCKI